MPFNPYLSLPYGLSLITPTLTPPDRRDLLDFAGSNTIQTSKYINPTTQDFEISSDNHFQGMNHVEQEVLLALNTTFNSSVVNGFGQNFGSIQVITPFINKQMTTLLNQALSNLINNNLISILGKVKVLSSPQGAVSINFSYNNNSISTVVPMSFVIKGNL